MDVRCDRCQTEYELEDDSVAERGASVQCTTCGHTFVVSKQAPAATPTPGPTTEMNAPAWLLTTEEGKAHRFRDPTTLQKWIVERRVGRNDRVTPPGGGTRRLGDMDELRPFFDLVDQADRASTTRGARPTQPETPQRLTAAGARGYSSSSAAPPDYASPDEDDDDMLMGGRRSRGGAQRGRAAGRLDSEITAGLSGMGVDDSIDVVIPQRKLGKYLVRGLVLAGLAIGAWYLGSRSGTSKVVATAPAPAVAAPAPAAAPPAAPAPAPAPPPAAPATPPAAAAAPAAAATAAAPAPPPAAAAAPPAAAPPAPRAAAPAAAPPEPGPSPSRSSARAASSAADSGGRPRGYESLVAEADRALENGNTAKAQKLIDEALKLQPNGVAVVTSSGYLLLDKHKPLAAIGEFKRALNNSPNFPQALFGLGEAYRAAGQPSQAVEAYKRYVEAAPGGSDAPAARRQIRELESQPARPTHSATATVPGEGAPVPPPPMPQPAPPP
jgi:predicted Zn finger-like uncharacterized protein